MSPAARWLAAPASPVFVARGTLTLTACALAAGVALIAPAWARPVLDAVAVAVLASAAAYVAGLALTAAGDAAEAAATAARPRALRAAGRLAFRVARACYAAARAE